MGGGYDCCSICSHTFSDAVMPFSLVIMQYCKNISYCLTYLYINYIKTCKLMHLSQTCKCSVLAPNTFFSMAGVLKYFCLLSLISKVSSSCDFSGSVSHCSFSTWYIVLNYVTAWSVSKWSGFFFFSLIMPAFQDVELYALALVLLIQYAHICE